MRIIPIAATAATAVLTIVVLVFISRNYEAGPQPGTALPPRPGDEAPHLAEPPVPPSNQTIPVETLNSVNITDDDSSYEMVSPVPEPTEYPQNVQPTMAQFFNRTNLVRSQVTVFLTAGLVYFHYDNEYM